VHGADKPEDVVAVPTDAYYVGLPALHAAASRALDAALEHLAAPRHLGLLLYLSLLANLSMSARIGAGCTMDSCSSQSLHVTCCDGCTAAVSDKQLAVDYAVCAGTTRPTEAGSPIGNRHVRLSALQMAPQRRTSPPL
jgi:hypothetical protein